MRKSTGRAMFEAMSMLTAQQMALSNPNSPVAPKPKELSPEEVRANKKRTLAEAFEKEYREREERRERESNEAQARGATLELLQHLGASKDEQRTLARCPLSEVPAALADLRRPAPANMEVLEKIYSVLK
jgi:hypothetical protein